MKIIAGRLKGRVIPVAKHATYRPSTGKVKEAIFSILTSGKRNAETALANLTVLDLFSGTASLGFEALSRGAKHVTLVDLEPLHLKAAEAFAQKASIRDEMTFLHLDATNLPKHHIHTYDIAFIDPPYFKSLAEKALASLHDSTWLNRDAHVIVELAKQEDIVLSRNYQLISTKIYGNTKLLILNYRSWPY